jgi:hypothetical protein
MNLSLQDVRDSGAAAAKRHGDGAVRSRRERGGLRAGRSVRSEAGARRTWNFGGGCTMDKTSEIYFSVNLLKSRGYFFVLATCSGHAA